MSYILFDIGGTNTRVSVSANLRSFEEPIKYKTPKEFDTGITELVAVAKSFCNIAEIQGVAGGIRGPLRKDKEALLSETVLTDWVEKPIVSTLKERFNAPVFLENDAAIVGLGEAHFGAGRGHGIVAYHTVSTGVGGARIDHGVIDSASIGFEPGHQALDPDGTLCQTCGASTLQDLVSGAALEKRRGVKPYEIPQDDPVWDELAKWLAYGLKNTVVYWSPDVIVLGGSMIIGDPRIFREDIVKYTKRALEGLVPCPPILDAKLDAYGGLYGAMALLSQK